MTQNTCPARAADGDGIAAAQLAQKLNIPLPELQSRIRVALAPHRVGELVAQVKALFEETTAMIGFLASNGSGPCSTEWGLRKTKPNY